MEKEYVPIWERADQFKDMDHIPLSAVSMKDIEIINEMYGKRRNNARRLHRNE